KATQRFAFMQQYQGDKVTKRGIVSPFFHSSKSLLSRKTHHKLIFSQILL
ncbi:hypothetical protein HMPREF1869_00232, partial [Bacteroidales bacterium KA00251]